MDRIPMNVRIDQGRVAPGPCETVSCPYIEGSLVFALGNLCLCCITNHGKGYPKVADYEGGELPLKRILARRRQVRNQNQREERYPRCAGCGYLEKRRWEPAAHPFRHLVIAHFTRCNLRCRYCYVLKHGYLEKPYTPYDILPVLRSMAGEGLLSPEGHVSWGGGEPVLYDGFEPAFRFLLEYGVTQDVNTNGTVLSDPILEGLRRGRVSLACGVDAGTAGTYRRMKGRNLFEQVWKNLEAYAATGGEVAAKIIVTTENHHEVAPFVERAKAAGVRRIVYDVDYFEPEQPDEVVRAIGLLIKEATEEPGVRVSEGGGGIASFGESLRTRIAEGLDRAVTWQAFQEKRDRIRELDGEVRSLAERVAHLEESRAIRLSRWFSDKHPAVMEAVRQGLSLWNRARAGRRR